PGVQWLRLPLPFARLDHINVWLLADGDGLTLVDTGIRSRTSQAVWEEILAGPLAGQHITRLIVTHFHPDHCGLAGWLAERFGVRLWMPRTEWLMARTLTLDAANSVPDEVLAFYHRLGFTPDMLAAFRAAGYSQYRRGVHEPPRSYRRIQDGEDIAIGDQLWRVIVGRGHAPEHACLYCGAHGVLIGGDQVLATITPHIGVYANEPDGDPLGEYLDSLAVFRPLPQDTLVLPSHLLPYRGLHTRLDQLRAHHDDRLRFLLAALTAPRTAVDLVPALFGRKLQEPADWYFAVGETLSHLNRLAATAAAVRATDTAGVWRWHAGEAAS
ncbi:MAG: MBL fold metallo-hydrolase, partial [Alphaproteobacteria bacterium]|nr:MBL fold metallo-hydrolase [Alphaproteobacteria bacterium]